MAPTKLRIVARHTSKFATALTGVWPTPIFGVPTVLPLQRSPTDAKLIFFPDRRGAPRSSALLEALKSTLLWVLHFQSQGFFKPSLVCLHERVYGRSMSLYMKQKLSYDNLKHSPIVTNSHGHNVTLRNPAFRARNGATPSIKRDRWGRA